MHPWKLMIIGPRKPPAITRAATDDQKSELFGAFSVVLISSHLVYMFGDRGYKPLTMVEITHGWCCISISIILVARKRMQDSHIFSESLFYEVYLHGYDSFFFNQCLSSSTLPTKNYYYYYYYYNYYCCYCHCHPV